MLWASENEMLREIRLDDVPEDPMMSHVIKDIRWKFGGAGGYQPTAATCVGEGGLADGASGASMEMMARSSQSMVDILSKLQESNKSDRKKKDSEKSILRTMVPTQRSLFTALCTRSMSREPVMSEFMINLTTSKSPQKAIDLLLSETRDWEGTFSEGSFHKMLSHGFLSPDANRANPGGFTIFMFYPKTADTGGKAFGGGGKGSTDLLREYLGMDVEESTLAYYMKQGFYTPSTANDLRVQLQTVLDTLELLTCDGTIAGKGLAHVLNPRRWGRLTTVLNDRFRAEADFGAKFCYTLDRHLQTFLDRMTRWGEEVATEGQPRYLVSKAEELLEELEDGQGLNVVLPLALRTGRAELGKKRVGSDKSADKSPSKKQKSDSSDEPDPGAAHNNTELIDAWQLPTGVKFLDLFNTKMPGLKGWPVLLDTRIPKRKSLTHKAPISVTKYRHATTLIMLT